MTAPEHTKLVPKNTNKAVNAKAPALNTSAAANHPKTLPAMNEIAAMTKLLSRKVRPIR
jgi:hypothetical protein